MHSSALSKVFYENAWSIYYSNAHLVTNFRTDLMLERSELYAEAIKMAGGWFIAQVRRLY